MSRLASVRMQAMRSISFRESLCLLWRSGTRATSQGSVDLHQALFDPLEVVEHARLELVVACGMAA
jgi:hypothetical protein